MNIMPASPKAEKTPTGPMKGTVDMTHGGGGRAMSELIEKLFARHFSNPFLDQGDDGALLPEQKGRLVMASDGHVISPLFFPGGDIGSLSVHGTINDLAMTGARPLYLTAGFILEEGYPLADLEAIVISMAKAAKEAGVPIVSGDTKVVERGKGDGVFITTTGLGVVEDGVEISGRNARPGDVVIISGPIGNHGIAILSKRENLEFETEIKSDTAALHEMVAVMLKASPDIAVLRDPTRGGVAATLNEIAHQAGVGMVLDENAMPMDEEVSAACELLGIDPLYVANEGKLICICRPGDADKILAAMKAHPLGERAAIIGEIVEDDACLLRMKTLFGGERVVDWLAGEQLPRIC